MSRSASIELPRTAEPEDDTSSYKLKVCGYTLNAKSRAPKANAVKQGVPIKLFACLLYMFVGPALILVNKKIMVDLEFSYPLVVSSIGLAATSVLSHFVVRVLKTVELEHKEKVTNRFYLRNMVPVGIAMAATLAFGNAVYLHLGVALIQMLKAFTPVIVMIGLVLANIERPTWQVVACVAGISVGTAVNCSGTMDYSGFGLLLMFGSETFEAVRLVLTQKLLQNEKFGVVEGQYWLAPASFFSLVAFATMKGEYGEIMSTGASEIFWSNKELFFASAFLGIVVNLASFLVVRVTSSVMLKVLNIARTAGLVLFQVVFAGEVITSQQFLGYAVTLAAFAGYNYFKMTQSPSMDKLKEQLDSIEDRDLPQDERIAVNRAAASQALEVASRRVVSGPGDF